MGYGSLKILHLSSPLSWRGGEQQVEYLISELKILGIPQGILCPTNSEMLKRSASYGVPVYSQYKSSGLSLAFAKKIKALCVNEHYTIVHAHDSHAHTFAFLAALLGNKAAIVVSRRVDFPLSRSFLSKRKYNHKNVKRILCVSDTIRRIVQDSIGRKERAKTVYSGVDPRRFSKETDRPILRKELGLDKNIRIVGNVAALADHKDYPTWFNAVKELRNIDQLHFVWIGGGELRKEMEAQIKKDKLEDKITLMGHRDDLPLLLPDFDIFLFSSKTEGLGTSVLDAWACEIPVIATIAGGIPEMITHEETGVLVETGDYKGMSKEILRLLEDQKLSQRFVTNATKKLERFDYRNTAKATLQEYYTISLEKS